MGFIFSQKKFLFLVLLAAVLVFSFLPIFMGRFVMDDDATQYSLPAFKFYADSIREGESFRMVPQVMSGFPFYLTYVGGFDEPLNYAIFRFLPYPFSYVFRIFLNYFLASLFVFLLCLELRLSPFASLAAALAFLTAQDIQGGMNMVHSSSFFFLPGLFYVVSKIFGLKKFFSLSSVWRCFLGAAVSIVGILGGAAQLNLQSSVAVFFFSVFLGWRKYKEEGRIARLLPPFFLILIIAIASLAIFYPQLLRVGELVSSSQRSEGVRWEDISDGLSGLLLRAKSVIYVFFPKTFQIPGIIESGGGGYVFFMGSAALALFFLFFAAPRDLNWYFWLGLFLFSAASSLPYPLFWLMHKLPVFNVFRNPPSWLLVSSFAASVMSAMGWDALEKKSISSKKVLYINGVLGLGSLTVFVFLMYRWFYFSSLVVLNPPSATDIFVPLLLWGAAITLFCLWIIGYKPKLLKLFLFFLLAVNFAFPSWNKLFKEATSVKTAGIFETPRVYEAIRENENNVSSRGPFRTFNFYAGDTQWGLFVTSFNPTAQGLADFQREFTRPNLYHLLEDIESVRGYDNLVTRRYKRVLSFIEGKPAAQALKKTDDDIFFFDISPAVVEILGMMNVKYMWSVIFLNLEPFGDKIKPVKDILLSVFPLHLYENREFLSRVFSPPQIVFLLEDENNFAGVIEKEHSFKQVGFLECDECPSGATQTQIPPILQIKETHNDSISFSSEGPEEAWVIISNSFIPRWHAYIDGQETKIYYANYIYQGIKVPAGKHEVLLRYEL